MKRFTIIAAVLGLATLAAAAGRPLSTMISGTVAVSSTAQAVPGGGCAVYIVNPNATPVYVGGANVTTDNGIAICTDVASCTRSDLPANTATGIMYLVKAGDGTVTVRYMAGGGC